MARLGVILDSGGVLLRPTGDRWFPPPSFYELLSERGLTCDQGVLDRALAVGGAYLDEVHPVPVADEQAERGVWVRYYDLVLEEIGLTASRGELAEVMTTAGEAELTVEPYPWTRPVLTELRRREIPVVVLSDAWPSLRRWFRELNLASFLRGMVISAEEGITKPDRRVFERALSLLGYEAGDVVFVDDDPEHVRAAHHLGMEGLRLRHPGDEPAAGIEEITDLGQLLARL